MHVIAIGWIEASVDGDDERAVECKDGQDHQQGTAGMEGQRVGKGQLLTFTDEHSSVDDR